MNQIVGFEIFNNQNDCVKQIAQLFQHQLNVIRGNIVQFYYFMENDSINFMENRDNFLFELAKNYTGIEFYNQGVFNNLRHIDILFEDYKKADEFKKMIYLDFPFFKIHKNLVITGTVMFSLQTLEDILFEQKKTIKAYCGDYKFDIPEFSNHPISVSLSSICNKI